MHSVDRFKKLASQERFKGWPLVGEPKLGAKIPFFGQVLEYQLRTGSGEQEKVEDYFSLLRHFGWAVVFGVTQDKNVVTLCQWKPGVNRAGWELPPGGIGKISSTAPIEEICQRTKEAYLKETGFGKGLWEYLGCIMIETGKYRGAGPDDHGLPAHLFLAADLEHLQDARKPNSNEIMETLMVPLPEFKQVLESGLFLEASAVCCAYKALVSLGRLHWR